MTVRNRRVEGLLLCAAALLLVGLFIARWDREGWRDHDLSVDQAVADSDVIVVSGGCHGDERATVEETDTAAIYITHDLAVIAETCDRVVVMYGGRIQEVAKITDLFDNPLHPYTQGLLGSIPTQASKGKPLPLIEGNVPSIFNFPSGCRFRSRCPLAEERCAESEPELRTLAPGREVRCHLVESAGVPTAEVEA